MEAVVKVTVDPDILIAPLLLVLVMVPRADCVTAPAPVQVIEPPVVLLVTAALKAIPALALTVKVLVVVAIQSMALDTVTVPVLLPFVEAVVITTSHVARFAKRFGIFTVAVAGLVGFV